MNVGREVDVEDPKSFGTQAFDVAKRSCCFFLRQDFEKAEAAKKARSFHEVELEKTQL